MTDTGTEEPPESLAVRFPDHMQPSDAVMWDIEKDPVLRSTVTAVAILDRAPDWDVLVERMERVSRLVPRLRQRVIVPPLRMGMPQWVVDPKFDLGYHLRRVVAPAPGSLRDVLDVVEPIVAAPFDRSRPLWEFTLVEEMDGGGAALIQKLHHSLTDGVGGVELAMQSLDDAAEPVGRGPLPPAPSPGRVDPGSVLLRALGDQVGQAGTLVRGLPGTMLRGAFGVVADPIGQLGEVRDLAASMVKMLAPVPRSPSDLIAARGLERRFHAIDIPLRDLKAAGHHAGGTINDALMAAVVEGLRRYHLSHGVVIPDLRITMPISLRHEGDDLGGNRFVPARFVVAARGGDPVACMQEVGLLTRAWQHEPALGLTDVVAFALDRLPVSITTAFFGTMLKHVDTVVTNVPGLPEGLYFAGAKLLREYAFAPPAGAAMNVALFSFGDQACIGVVVDSAAIPDDDVLMGFLLEGFEFVRSAVDHHEHRKG